MCPLQTGLALGVPTALGEGADTIVDRKNSGLVVESKREVYH
jgi:hypothetical protein